MCQTYKGLPYLALLHQLCGIFIKIDHVKKGLGTGYNIQGMVRDIESLVWFSFDWTLIPHKH